MTALCSRAAVSRAILTAIALAAVLCVAGLAQVPVQPDGDMKAFLSNMVGEWIGTCQQSTDGKEAADKYFYAVVKKLDDGSIEGTFTYYRFDESTGKPLAVGETKMAISVAADGKAVSTITGKGIVLVDDRPKNQEHKLAETIIYSSSGSLQGKGSGSISVSGMPLGLGKNGKVKDSTSTWTMKDGVMQISQKMRVGFRALVFSKNFDIEANYVARHGTDVAALMRESRQASAAKPVAH